MTNDLLLDWAWMWGVSQDALDDLQARIMQAVPPAPGVKADGSEAYTSSLVRLAAPTGNYFLTRNNVGALQDKAGRLIRFGLANESKAMNETMKSGDMIGWQRVVITPEMVGTRIARFTSIECKHASWQPGEDPVREAAQRRWAEFVIAAGGKACFSTGGLPE